MSKNGLFIGNGDIENADIIASKLRSNYDYIIALDGGIKHCKDLKIIANLVIGDLDSVKNIDLKGITVIKKQSQDLTDFQFAADYCLAQFNITKIDAIAVTSLSRIDHSLLNIYQTIYRLKDNIEVKIITKNNIIISLDSGKHQVLCKKGQTISLIIFIKTFINSTQNLHWNLDNFSTQEPWFGVSNIAEDDLFYIDIEYGNVMIIMINAV